MGENPKGEQILVLLGMLLIAGANQARYSCFVYKDDHVR
jgi:hypothetical protein